MPGDHYKPRYRTGKPHTDRYRPGRDNNSYASRRRDIRSRSRHRSCSPRNANTNRPERYTSEFRRRFSDVREDRPSNPPADINRDKNTPELPPSVRRAQQLLAGRTIVSYMDLCAPPRSSLEAKEIGQVNKLTPPPQLRHPLPPRPPPPVSLSMERGGPRFKFDGLGRRLSDIFSHDSYHRRGRDPGNHSLRVSSQDLHRETLVPKNEQTSLSESKIEETQILSLVDGVENQPPLSRSEDTTASALRKGPSPSPPSSEVIATEIPEKHVSNPHSTFSQDHTLN